MVNVPSVVGSDQGFAAEGREMSIILTPRHTPGTESLDRSPASNGMKSRTSDMRFAVMKTVLIAFGLIVGERRSTRPHVSSRANASGDAHRSQRTEPSREEA